MNHGPQTTSKADHFSILISGSRSSLCLMAHSPAGPGAASCGCAGQETELRRRLPSSHTWVGYRMTVVLSWGCLALRSECRPCRLTTGHEGSPPRSVPNPAHRRGSGCLRRQAYTAQAGQAVAALAMAQGSPTSRGQLPWWPSPWLSQPPSDADSAGTSAISLFRQYRAPPSARLQAGHGASDLRAPAPDSSKRPRSTPCAQVR